MKKLLSILVSIVMIITMFGAVSFADESGELNAVSKQSSSSVKSLGKGEVTAALQSSDAAKLAGVGTVTFVKAGTTSYRISWTKPSIPSGRKFVGYFVYDVVSEDFVASTTNQNTLTATVSAGKGYYSGVIVGYAYTDSSHSTSNPGTEEIGTAYVNTLPIKVSTSKIDVYSYASSSVTLGHNYNKNVMADGIQYELRKYNGTKVGTKKSTSTARFNCKKNTGYKYRARLYVKNGTDGKTYYGSWSGYEYFDNPSVSSTFYSNKKIKLKIKKGTYVKAFNVYISTKASSGYKKAKTIKVGSKSSYTTTITKYGSSSLKRGKTYYIKVVPVMKNGKTSRIAPLKQGTIP